MIRTERLAITELTEDMAEDIQRQSRDEATRRFLPDEVFDTLEEAQETVRELMKAYQSTDGPYVYAVIRERQFVGYVQLSRIEKGWEIGYHIGDAYRSHGYAVESVRAFLPIIMERLSLREVWGVADEDNAASCRVLEKCGFQLVKENARKRYLFKT